ncbi:MAG: sialidase family protein [Planctomycetota bacterium]
MLATPILLLLPLLPVLPATGPTGNLPAEWGGIPLLDLNDDPDRFVTVDREAGQYLGHVSTVRPFPDQPLGDDGAGGANVVFAAYPKGHGKGAIMLKRSDDGGQTWSERLPTPANWATSLETPTLFRVVDPAGTPRLILWSGLNPARLAVSEDHGENWSPLAPVGPPQNRWGGIVVMGDQARVGPGEYLAMFHDDGRFLAPDGGERGDFRLLQTRSADGGLTWSEPRTIWRGNDVNLCEPGFVRSPDGRTLAALLRENRRVKNSHITFTTDGGQHWAPPREMPETLTGDRHQAVRVPGEKGPDGRLFISFRDTAAGSPTRGDWVAWVGTWDDLVGGRPGQYRVRLKDNTRAADCAYPGVEALPDGTILAVTYGHWEQGEPPYILAARLRLEELDARLGSASVE